MSEGWDLIGTIEGSKSRGADITPNIFSLLHPLVTVVEWSEQLRPVTSVWLGAVRRSVPVLLCTSGCKSEKLFGVISPPRDLLPSIIMIIIIIIIVIIIIISSLVYVSSAHGCMM